MDKRCGRGDCSWCGKWYPMWQELETSQDVERLREIGKEFAMAWLHQWAAKEERHG